MSNIEISHRPDAINNINSKESVYPEYLHKHLNMKSIITTVKTGIITSEIWADSWTIPSLSAITQLHYSVFQENIH